LSTREAFRANNVAFFIHAELETIKGRLLDVGCGSKPYKRMFDNVDWVGLDIRPVADIEADFHDIPCEDAEFDTILCTDALQYAKDPALVAREMARVLKPGGTLLVVAPATDIDDGTAFWSFRVEGLKHILAEAGLRVERAARVDFPGGGVISGFLHDMAEVDVSTTLPGAAKGWAKKMDEMMPTMVAAVATKQPSTE
jgi:SAM-dependent methyltransferase